MAHAVGRMLLSSHFFKWKAVVDLGGELCVGMSVHKREVFPSRQVEVIFLLFVLVLPPRHFSVSILLLS